MCKSELAILIILRFLGVAALFALPAVFLPYEWMNAIHGWAGLGDLPEAPIVEYLTRSLSLFYFTFGVLTLALSTDIRKYRSLIALWAVMIILMNVILIGIDLYAGMPLDWTLAEGPPAIIVGLLVLWLLRNVGETAPA